MTPEEMMRAHADEEAAYKRAKWKALFGVGAALVGLYFALARMGISQTSVFLLVGAAALAYLIFGIWLWRH